MKKFLLVISMIVCFINVWASGKYSIFNVIGHVEVKKNGWHDAKKHEEVDLQTEFKIYKGGEVVIVDKENGLTIKYNKPTTGRVLLRDIIRESNSNRSSTLLLLIKEMFTGQNKPILGFKSIGGVTLGITNAIEKDLSDMIRNYAFSKDEKNSGYINHSLLLSKVKRENKCFTFKITNLSSDSLYVNIIAFNKEKMTYSSPLDVLMSNSSKTLDGLFIVVPANNEIILDQYEPEWLFTKCDNVQYRVFGSTRYFENHNVVELLTNKATEYTNISNSPHNIFIGVNK